jgi:hypothetical protein
MPVVLMTMGVWLTGADIQAECGIAEGEDEALMEEFEALHMIHRDEGGPWVITNWETRNLESDNATRRSRRSASVTRRGVRAVAL